MATEIRVPQLGESLTEATVGRWLKQEGDSVAEGERIAEALRTNPVTFTVGHTQHFYPIVAAAKRLLDSQRVGETIMAIDTWYKPHEPEKRPSWMLDRSKGGGMLLMDGAHLIDRLIWHLGGKVFSVKAVNGNPVYPEFPADDTGMVAQQQDIAAEVERAPLKRAFSDNWVEMMQAFFVKAAENTFLYMFSTFVLLLATSFSSGSLGNRRSALCSGAPRSRCSSPLSRPMSPTESAGGRF